METLKPIPREHRFCPWCPNTVEDEFHFIFNCYKYEHLRRAHLPEYFLFFILLNSHSKNTLNKLANFLNSALKIRSQA